MSFLVVVVGPPLPGRDLLQRALEAALPTSVEVVGGTYSTVAEREALARARVANGDRVVFVSWQCTADEAWRETFRHYTSMPQRMRADRWDEVRYDLAHREPCGREAWPLVDVHAGDPLDDAVARVLAVLDTQRAGVAAGAPRVLVVEDEPAQRALLCEALELLGCEVRQADCAEAALEIARTAPLDLVVTDQSMPGMTGTALASALHAVRPDLRVAVYTAHPDEALDALEHRHDVDVVLAKPIGIVDLVHTVEELARRRPAAT